MTFSLEFDLLMIGVCTFIQKKQKKKRRQKNKNKKEQKKKRKKNKKKETKKTKKRQKKMQRYVCVSYFTPSIFFFFVGFISEGLSEILMRNELCESSMRSFVPWIMTDMYLI